jgi:hypothetical protein
MIKFNREEIARLVQKEIEAQHGVAVPMNKIEPVEKGGVYPGEWWFEADVLKGLE